MKHESKQGDNLGAKVLARKGSHHVYRTIPKSREWFIVNCVVNVTEVSMLKYYVFRGERMKENYIRNFK
jgi:hypothetical protein